MATKKSPRKKTTKKQAKKTTARAKKTTTAKSTAPAKTAEKTTTAQTSTGKKAVTFSGTKIKGVTQPETVSKVEATPSTDREVPVAKTGTAAPAMNESNLTLDKILSALLALGLIAGFAWFGFYYLPEVILQEDAAIQADREAQEEEEAAAEPVDQAELDAETEELGLSFTDQTLNFKTNFGDIRVDMLDEAAPRNVENIIRLAARDYYDGLTFHRIVETENFGVIQGGDPEGNGLGGESAFGTDVEDEIFLVEPEITQDESGLTRTTNNPVFRRSLYRDFDAETGRIVYPKGLMIMANSGPDTNGSQFFFTTTDTTLAPSYTIVGQINAEDLSVLDEITAQVDPISADGTVTEDGTPNQAITIEEVEIV